MTRIKRNKRAGAFGRRIRATNFLSLMVIVVFVAIASLCRHSLSVISVNYQSSTFSGNNVAGNDQWAYAFLLADVDPELPFYRGMLYNILVTTFALKFDKSAASQSKAEIVVLVQLAPTSKARKLPEEDFLKRMNIRVEYLTENDDGASSFYALVLSKFEIFKLTEYNRVLFLDGDVLPLCNLDYLLALSEKGELQETVLHAMYEDPVNAGLFVISPKPGYYQEIQSIIQRHGIPSKENWDPKIGWGKKDDEVRNNEYRLWDHKKPGTGWDFYCADADQGLLLYWAKFVRRKVSIIVGPIVEHYVSSTTPTITSTAGELMDNSCLPPLLEAGSRTKTFAQNSGGYAASLPVYQDFFHMVGYSKAWEMPPTRLIPKSKNQVESSSEYWYFLLQQVKLQFDIDDIIPSLDELSASIPKPRVRGELFSVIEKNPGT